MAETITMIGAMDRARPASYGKNKRIAFASGFWAASYGTSVNACPTLAAEWRREAWRAGHAAYHEWLQQNRVRACDRVEATHG